MYLLSFVRGLQHLRSPAQLSEGEEGQFTTLKHFPQGMSERPHGSPSCFCVFGPFLLFLPVYKCSYQKSLVGTTNLIG